MGASHPVCELAIASSSFPDEPTDRVYCKGVATREEGYSDGGGGGDGSVVTSSSEKLLDKLSRVLGEA